MSREDSKTTTGKKSYSEVVSPFKKKKKKKKATSNSFFSLSEESRYPSSLPPRKTITMGKNVNVAAVTNVSPTGSQSEPSLHEKLEELIPSVADGTKKNPHEIIKGLNGSGTTTWIDFVRMDEADIPLIHYFANGATIPLSAQSLRFIINIKQMIWKNVKDKVPNAKLASTYNITMLDDYIDEIRDQKKTKIHHTMH